MGCKKGRSGGGAICWEGFFGIIGGGEEIKAERGGELRGSRKSGGAYLLYLVIEIFDGEGEHRKIS